MKIFTPIFLLFLGACNQNSGYVESDRDLSPVILIVENNTLSNRVRCLVSFAHFITYDAPIIPAGGFLKLSLQRGQLSGTLYFQRGQTPLMAIENIICGDDQQWTETKIDLMLGELRQTARDHLNLSCEFTNVLSCSAVQEN